MARSSPVLLCPVGSISRAVHQLIQQLQQLKHVQRHWCHEQDWHTEAGLARNGTGRQCYSPQGTCQRGSVSHRAPDRQPQLRHQALGDVPQKVLAKGVPSRFWVPRLTAMPRSQGRAGRLCRTTPVLHTSPSTMGRVHCTYCELTCNLTDLNSRTEEMENSCLGKVSALSPWWLSEPQGGEEA